MSTTRRPRERPPPNDIRVELFTRLVLDQDAARQGPGSAAARYKAFADDLTVRFRAWKARYTYLLRAVEWCLPWASATDDSTDASVAAAASSAYGDAVERVRGFAASKYATFVEMDSAACVDCFAALEDSTTVRAAPAVNSNEERACLLVVFGSAADSQQQQQQQDDGSSAAAASPRQKAGTCSGLRAVFFRNVTAAFLDSFVGGELLRLIVQMRIHAVAPSSPSPARSLRCFHPLTHEPLRRFSCVVASATEIVIVEPLAAFRAQYAAILRRLLLDGAAPASVTLTGVVLGDSRDAVMLNAADLAALATEASNATAAVDSRVSLPSTGTNATVIALSPHLQLRRSAVSPSGLFGASADTLALSVTVPQQQQAVSVATFTGDAVCLDSFVDGVVTAADVHAFFERLSAQEEMADVAGANSLLLPSHGGYSWVTPQLELSWIAIAGLARKSIFAQPPLSSSNSGGRKAAAASSSAAVVAAVCPTQYVAPVASALHAATHLRNRRHLGAATAAAAPGQPPLLSTLAEFGALFGELSPSQAMFLSRAPLVLDTRPPRDYETLRVAGSLTVPFTFPATERGAKKSEIWLTQLLLPGQPLVVVVPDDGAAQRETLERIRAVVPHEVCPCVALVSTAALQRMAAEPPPSSSVNVRFVRGASQRFQTLPTYEAVSAALRDTSSSGGGDAAIALRAVVDCRTPVEFQQGSYVRAANVPLSDIRNWILWLLQKQTQPSAPSVAVHGDLTSWMAACGADAPPPAAAPRLDILPGRPALFQPATADDSGTFLPSERESLAAFRRMLLGEQRRGSVLVFCAGGFRSRIFMSVVDAALDVAAVGGGEGSEIRVGDVGRGAVELMSQHASEWQVKDRAIMCVS